ncbi:putative protein disulfide-isomerase [Rosa chinensis]|uniref:Uncharacterized protein n=1 Tax=Rosa chinensis TaxID=74649 RepID=A0A2P6PLY9_ROSCH|nr:putative protein disulfide-isomerase [Rosa chinensis]
MTNQNGGGLTASRTILIRAEIQKNEVDPILASFSGGAVGVILTLTVAEKYGVSGYSALNFFPKGNKDGEECGGGRDLEDFVNVINEKCRTSRDVKGQLTSKVMLTL